jgi:hypothetical protein
MPLEPGTSNEIMAHNAAVEGKAHPRMSLKQRWAIAYDNARRHPDGGTPPPASPSDHKDHHHE